jgi:hypothetical protein
VVAGPFVGGLIRGVTIHVGDRRVTVAVFWPPVVVPTACLTIPCLFWLAVRFGIVVVTQAGLVVSGIGLLADSGAVGVIDRDSGRPRVRTKAGHGGTDVSLDDPSRPAMAARRGHPCPGLPADQHRDIGGDWYDTFPLPGGRVRFAVGDVVGHDVRAAAAVTRPPGRGTRRPGTSATPPHLAALGGSQ